MHSYVVKVIQEHLYGQTFNKPLTWIYLTNTLAWYIRNKHSWIHDNLIHYVKYTFALIHGAHNMLARLLDPYNAPAWMNDQDNMLAWLLD